MDLDTTDLLDSLGASVQAPTAPATISDPSTHYAPGLTSSIEDRALSLLGSGIKSESVASALGVSPSRISQLLAEKHFSDKVAELRYKNLQAHNQRDDKYDSLEDKLIAKLDKSLPLMVRPDTILKAINVINGAKRRGQSSPDTANSTTNIVNIVLPKVIAQKIVTNINNQVTKAGDQELLTMPSGNLLKQVEDAAESRLDNKQQALLEHEQNTEDTDDGLQEIGR